MKVINYLQCSFVPPVMRDFAGIKQCDLLYVFYSALTVDCVASLPNDSSSSVSADHDLLYHMAAERQVLSSGILFSILFRSTQAKTIIKILYLDSVSCKISVFN